MPGQPEGAPPPLPPPTRAAPVPSEIASDPADPTAALPIMRPETDDSEAATEKINARGQADQSDNGDDARPRRRGGGGGVSAADLLRREGRL
jgi:trehalose monomycolate/heme transporter